MANLLKEAISAERAAKSIQDKVIGGPVYTAYEIDRLHYGPKPST